MVLNANYMVGIYVVRIGNPRLWIPISREVMNASRMLRSDLGQSNY